jgi:hypothetical protein
MNTGPATAVPDLGDGFVSETPPVARDSVVQTGP